MPKPKGFTKLFDAEAARLAQKKVRRFHLATAFWLMPRRMASVLRLA